MKTCPCNSNKTYSECCKKVHDEIRQATSAELLMRSRYSAFVLADTDYLYRSHHSKTRPSKKEHEDIKKWTKSVQWLKLEVLNSTKDTVHFKAFYMENGQIQVIEENSKFVKENGYWVYYGANE